MYLLGGRVALSQDVEDRLVELGYETIRYGGADRYGTARIIFTEGLGSPDTVLFADGTDFPDALAASPAGSAIDGGILLPVDEQAPQATTKALATTSSPTTFAVGGPASRAVPFAQGIVGAERLATTRLVAEEFYDEPTIAGLATATDFADALTGGAQMGRLNGPMLLTYPGGLAPEATDYLRSTSSVADVVLYGGSGALAAAVETEVAALVAGR